MSVEYTKSEVELRSEVRSALGELSDGLIKDDNINQKWQWTENWISQYVDQDDYDDKLIDQAIVAYTAERAYKSLPQKSTISGGGVTANMAVSQYIENLEQQTSEALSNIGLTHPEKGSPAGIVTRTNGIFDPMR